MRVLLTLLFLSVACTVTYWAVASQDAKPAESVWMKKKLEYSKDILEGVTTENFETIERAATAMQRLSELEGFVRRKDTKAYRAQLAVFEFANEELLRHAETKNVDGAALAFTQLTLSCVNCHKQLRLPQQ
jgi:acyl-CoA synthetase (NDP forming)